MARVVIDTPDGGTMKIDTAQESVEFTSYDRGISLEYSIKHWRGRLIISHARFHH